MGNSANRAHLWVLVCVVAGACGVVSRDEVARVPSPDGALQAFVVETNAGATTSFGYEVWVAGKGDREATQVASLYGAVRNENAYGVNLKWSSDTALLIQYFDARDAEIEKSKLQIAGREVSVRLQDRVLDSTAPAGGMLYNLRGPRTGARQP